MRKQNSELWHAKMPNWEFSRFTRYGTCIGLLAQIDAVFEDFLERIRFVNLLADDRLDPVNNLFLLLRFAALMTRKTASIIIQITLHTKFIKRRGAN